MSERRFYVYFMSNRSRSVLYIGVTNQMERRVWEHRSGLGSAFVKKYRAHHLVYVEEYARADEAIAREKELKGWKRVRKNTLVVEANPTWIDLMPTDPSS